jgi:hypothetical protein
MQAYHRLVSVLHRIRQDVATLLDNGLLGVRPI